MKIALDFDETVTLDKYFWSKVILLAKNSNHEVTLVTSRPAANYDNADIEAFAEAWKVSIVYCAFKQKSACFQPDVWIDDYPASIPTYSELGG